tara:strand:+ start:360 stop:635 length:276 start_codon:yes stop_codon:yes gene_type:complete
MSSVLYYVFGLCSGTALSYIFFKTGANVFRQAVVQITQPIEPLPEEDQATPTRQEDTYNWDNYDEHYDTLNDPEEFGRIKGELDPDEKIPH